MTIEHSDDNPGLIARLRKRGVVRVAASYAVIAWLLLQIADVVLDPLGAPAWAMRAAIVVAALGFPVAVLLAWFYELGPDGIHRDTAPESAARPSAPGIRRFADLVIIGALLIVIGVLLTRGPEEAGPGDGESPVVAVLPFNEIGAAEDGFFGMGLADTLIHKLGRLPQLVVLTSNSTFEFRGPGLDLAAVGARLGASVLVEGTIQRAAGRLRINARMVEAKSGRQMWSEQYDRKSGDVFAVQDEIAAAVSSALSVVLSPADEQRLAQPVTSNLTAFDAYTLGQVNLARRGQHVRDAIDFFRQATGLDPDYALAHAALAEALHMAPYYLRADTDWEDVADEARAAAAAARELNPALAEAWLAQFYVAEAENRWSGEQIWLDEQLRNFLQRAIDLNPSSAAATRYLARYAATPEERFRLKERAALLDPRSGIIAYDVANEYANIGEHDRARDWLLKSGSTADPYFRIGYANIPLVYAFDAGRLDEAARWARLFDLAFPGDFDVIRHESLWDLGLMSEAGAVLEEIRNRAAESDDPNLRSYVLSNDFVNAWRNGDAESAASLFAQIDREYLQDFEEWPDLARYPGSDWLMALHAISLVRAGEPAHALDTYRTAFPKPLDYEVTLSSAVFIQPALMTAALMKLNGQDAEARQLVLQFLELWHGSPIGGRSGLGYARFMARALLGDAESARVAMREVLDANFTAMSWQLEVARFDADYRATLADPTVAAMYQELLARIAAMRESYLQQPELPPEIVPARFRSL